MIDLWAVSLKSKHIRKNSCNFSPESQSCSVLYTVRCALSTLPSLTMPSSWSLERLSPFRCISDVFQMFQIYFRFRCAQCNSRVFLRQQSSSELHPLELNSVQQLGGDIESVLATFEKAHLPYSSTNRFSDASQKGLVQLMCVERDAVALKTFFNNITTYGTHTSAFIEHIILHSFDPWEISIDRMAVSIYFLLESETEFEQFRADLGNLHYNEHLERGHGWSEKILLEMAIFISNALIQYNLPTMTISQSPMDIIKGLPWSVDGQVIDELNRSSLHCVFVH